MIPTINSYFSGAGGLDLGLTDAGCYVARSLEFDPHCCETLRMNFRGNGHEVISKDIREVTVTDQPSSDVVALTFPCTKYSAIADIHGCRTGDDLFLHAFRHIALQLPEAFVVENVPGMKKFKVVMECFTKIPNYYVQVFCPLDASNWLPQRRKRLIVVATRRSFHISAPKVATRKPRLSDIIEKDAVIKVPDYVGRRIMGKYRDLPIVSNPENHDELAPTCVAHYHKDLSTRLVLDSSYKHGLRPYTVREYARLQGFPDWFQFSGGDREAYKQIGNAVAVPMGQWIGAQLMKYFN